MSNALIQPIETIAVAPGNETVRFWRDIRLGGIECMSASFVTHRFSPHSHESFGIGAMEAGRKVATIRGVKEYSRPGDLYLINPEAIHDGGPYDGCFRYRMIYPDTSFLMRLMEEVSDRPLRGTPFFPQQKLTDPALAEAFLEMHRRLEAGAGTLEAEEAMICIMASLMARHSNVLVNRPVAVSSRAAELAREYIDAHFCEDIALEDLAAMAEVSRAHLIRSFRKAFHITPHAYQTHLRIRRAKALLRRGEAPAETAFQCGFADQAHFTRTFKAVNGITPGLYRSRAL
ncbi:AraC family transcriptional regulator [Allorhizobium undicola]|uniref:AraC family transcriptional regulator n=1 Tax=Allorhizobium undicola TaxID=78527 RepID=UPI003D330253